MYLIPSLYAVAGTLLTLMYGAMMYSFARKRASHLVYVFSLTILFFALFAWLIALPVFFSKGDLGAIFWGYTAAIATSFGTIYVGLIVQSYLSNSIHRRRFAIAKLCTVLVGLGAIASNIFQPEGFKIDHGILVWQGSLVASMLVAGAYLIYSIYWIRFFINFAKMLAKPAEKRNMLMLAMNGFSGGLGSVLVFGTANWVFTLIGAGLYVLGALSSLLVFVVIPIFEGTSKRIDSPF